jgi:hypothetical protein
MDTATVPAAKDIEERAAYVKGLRDLADFLETHTDVPVDKQDSLGPYLTYMAAMTPERAAAIADALDGVVLLDEHNYVRIERAFGPIIYRVTVSARDVCEEREELTKVHVLPEALKGRERS